MLHSHARGERGGLAFLGFTTADLAHLMANEPLSLDGASIGIPGKPVVILFETDPMVEFYAAQPWAVTVLFRATTIEALRRAGDTFLELPLNGPGIPEGKLALLFYAPSDDALVEILRRLGPVAETQLVHVGSAPTANTGARARDAPRAAATQHLVRLKHWLAALVCTAFAAFLVIAPSFMRVKSVAGVRAGALLFGAGAAVLCWRLWSTRGFR